MTNSDLIINLPSSRGWKKSERVIEDVEPTKLISETTTKSQDKRHENDSDSSTTLSRPTAGDGKDNVCLVCSENQARYTCPQCQTPYCSIECFRNHTNTGTSTFSCSEDFFKRKVASIMQLESSEQGEKARRALNRYHHENSSPGDFQEPLEGYDHEIEDLYELQAQLEILESNNKELSHQELAKLLPPSLKAMFEKDLQTGRIQAESILNHWYPWWKRELVVDTEETETDQRQEHSTDGTKSKILDERLLRVSKYQSFGGRKGNDDVLICNLIDILYSTCRTLRLYHGVENASRQAPIEAATTLISTSSVLSKDTRFDSIYQVLNHHFNATKDNNENISSALENDEGLKGDNHGTWHLYSQDVALIVISPRMIGRALLEATDVLKAAIKTLKVDHNSSISTGEELDKDKESNIKELRRLRKKIEFFLSWATTYPVAVNLLSGGGPQEEISAWIDERKQVLSEYMCDEDNDSREIAVDDSLGGKTTNSITELTLPVLEAIPTATNCFGNNSDNTRTSQQPLFVEVQSRMKT